MTVTDAIPDMARELRFFPAKTPNPKKLTGEEIAQFNEKGYIFPVDLSSPASKAMVSSFSK